MNNVGTRHAVSAITRNSEHETRNPEPGTYFLSFPA